MVLVQLKKGDVYRDVTMARTGETYLIKAEAIVTVNKLRARAECKSGEDREHYTDRSMAYVNNSLYATASNKTMHENSFLQKNTYYLSTFIALNQNHLLYS